MKFALLLIFLWPISVNASTPAKTLSQSAFYSPASARAAKESKDRIFIGFRRLEEPENFVGHFTNYRYHTFLAKGRYPGDPDATIWTYGPVQTVHKPGLYLGPIYKGEVIKGDRKYWELSHERLVLKEIPVDPKIVEEEVERVNFMARQGYTRPYVPWLAFRETAPTAANSNSATYSILKKSLIRQGTPREEVEQIMDNLPVSLFRTVGWGRDVITLDPNPLSLSRFGKFQQKHYIPDSVKGEVLEGVTAPKNTNQASDASFKNYANFNFPRAVYNSAQEFLTYRKFYNKRLREYRSAGLAEAEAQARTKRDVKNAHIVRDPHTHKIAGYQLGQKVWNIDDL